ncbi:MAG: integration host factor subunit alpha [Planctomycetota bacterium]|jgi:integration host factor subunit alpha
MTLTKNHHINSLSDQLSIPKRRSTTLVESFLDIMKDTLESGEDLLISGFGKFCVRDKNERRGRDPQKGKDKILDARRVVIFKCSGILREKINGKG